MAYHFYASIAIKVTSDDPSTAEVCEISIVPLAWNFLPCIDIVPITVYTTPRDPSVKQADISIRGKSRRSYPAYMMASKKDISMAQALGSTYALGLQIIEKWTASLKLYDGTKFTPLAYGYGYMLPFLTNWFGPINYEEMFDWHYRDVFSNAIYLNDRSRNLQLPRSCLGSTLDSMARGLGVQDDIEKDTMAIAVKQAKIYKKMLELFK